MDNQLYYDEEHLTNMVNKYDNERHTWSELGRLPVRADSSNGWGLAFKGCGEKLLVMSGQRGPEGFRNGTIDWKVLGVKEHLRVFVYNYAVMGWSGEMLLDSLSRRFAGIYNLTSLSGDYVDSMDELLQPLVDEAKLVGYSCRREWISAMVTSLTTYLAKEIFPSYISQVDEERVTGIQSSAIVSWLHLIDLTIAFDKRIKSLVDHSGITKAEGLNALTDDEKVIKVTISINAAHYFESVLKEWSEDVFFLEMGMDEDDQPEMENNSNNYGELLPESSKRFIFYDEIKKLEEFKTQWVEKISLVIFRGFDCHSRDYVNNKRQWLEGEEGWTMSKTLIEALDYLQSKMSVVEVSLNGRDFVGIWRSLAAGIDRLIFNGIHISKVKSSLNRD
ncbi:RINT1-like protein MAG2 [Glycine max]|nr:RINT1-like protein MAG2 [Glycine max]